MKLIDALIWSENILKEYNNSDNLVNISALGGKRAWGKSYDRMAQGLSDPYKNDDTYATKYAKVYPYLWSIVKRVKESAMPGDILVTGKAIDELNKLLSTFNPKANDNGEVGLPFGDNIRLKIKGDKVFIGVSQEKLEQTEQA